MQKISLALLAAILVAGCGQTPSQPITESTPEVSQEQITPEVTEVTESEEVTELPEESPKKTEPTDSYKQEPVKPQVETPLESQEQPPVETPAVPQTNQQETQVQETTVQAPVEETKEINLQGSLVEWLGEKIVGASHPGSFNLQSGQISLLDNKLQSGSFVIDINSLKSYEGISALEKHLLSDDFFNAPSFPTGKFETTNISYTSPTQLTITGSLTLKGKTNTETFNATHDLDSKTVTASLNLDRTKYDIIFGSGKFFKELADAAIKDIIPLDITLKY